MRLRGLRPIWVVLSLLLPGVLAQSSDPDLPWTQLNGGPGHPGYALLRSWPYDVLGTARMYGEDQESEVFGLMGYAEVGDDLFAVARAPDGSCVSTRLPAQPGATPTSRPIDGCERPAVLYVSADRGFYVVCPETNSPDAPLVQARRLDTDEVVWEVAPNAMFRLTASPLTIPAPLDPTAGWWCMSFAGDETSGAITLIEIPPGDLLRAYVVKLSLETGAVEWGRALDESRFQGGPYSASPAASPGSVRPWGITMTTTGVVVQATVRSGPGEVNGPGDAPDVEPDADAHRGVAVWFRSNGEFTASAVSETGVPGGPAAVAPERYSPHWAAARGPLAGFAMGGRLFLVNPSDTEPVEEVPFEPIASGHGWVGVVGPSWWEDHLLLPVGPAISDVDPSAPDELRWSWSPGPEYDVPATLIAPPGDVYAIAARPLDPGNNGPGVADLVRLSLEEGRVMSRLRLPLEITIASGRWYVQVLPLSDGRLIIGDDAGNVVFLGQADAALVPQVAPSDAYPDPGEEFTLSMPEGEGAAFVVAFGDSDPINASTGEVVAHRYASEGVRNILVTAVYPDGRTATSVATVRVGETPPPELNALQTAFSPGNQEVTFGLLGLLLTLGGALVALLARRRRRSKLDALMEELERIREGSASDALDAVRRLELFRAGVLGQLRKGDLDDAQFSVIELRVSRLLQSLRLRLLGPFAGRVSDEFRHMVEAALEDGRVSREEALALHAGLDRETRLTPEERARLASLVVLWEGAGAPMAGRSV